MSEVNLSNKEIVRYARQTSLPEVGMEGQGKLKQAKVLLVGAGGLGGPIALYLTSAGVGEITIIDDDEIELSNLHRQVLYTPKQIGQKKALIAADKLQQQNPEIVVNAITTRLNKSNVMNLVETHDIVVDGTDNFNTRYLINDACVVAKKPCVFGAIYQFEGMVSVFGLADGPCYRCLHPSPPPIDVAPSCAEGGVLGILPGVIGLLQATEVIKLIIGKGDVLSGRMLQFNALSMTFETFEYTADKKCKVCHSDDPLSIISSHPEAQVVCSLIGVDGDKIDLSVSEIKQLQENKKVQFFDVRSQKERDVIKIDQDHWLPIEQLEQHSDELAQNTSPIIFYCQSGLRSQRAATFLRDRGAENVYSLIGGVIAWHSAA